MPTQINYARCFTVENKMQYTNKTYTALSIDIYVLKDV